MGQVKDRRDTIISELRAEAEAMLEPAFSNYLKLCKKIADIYHDKVGDEFMLPDKEKEFWTDYMRYRMIYPYLDRIPFDIYYGKLDGEVNEV